MSNKLWRYTLRWWKCCKTPSFDCHGEDGSCLMKWDTLHLAIKRWIFAVQRQTLVYIIKCFYGVEQRVWVWVCHHCAHAHRCIHLSNGETVNVEVYMVVVIIYLILYVNIQSVNSWFINQLKCSYQRFKGWIHIIWAGLWEYILYRTSDRWTSTYSSWTDSSLRRW